MRVRVYTRAHVCVRARVRMRASESACMYARVRTTCPCASTRVCVRVGVRVLRPTDESKIVIIINIKACNREVNSRPSNG